MHVVEGGVEELEVCDVRFCCGDFGEDLLVPYRLRFVDEGGECRLGWNLFLNGLARLFGGDEGYADSGRDFRG